MIGRFGAAWATAAFSDFSDRADFADDLDAGLADDFAPCLLPLFALLGRAERDHVGVDWTGMNRVHPDFAAAEVDCRRLGHAPQRPFGRGIGEGPGRALEAGN